MGISTTNNNTTIAANAWLAKLVFIVPGSFTILRNAYTTPAYLYGWCLLIVIGSWTKSVALWVARLHDLMQGCSSFSVVCCKSGFLDAHSLIGDRVWIAML